ncbi:hypothetical protein [Herbaspirillum rubrisubalbicans]|uniref:Glycine zipper domain-containing protein n=1 Tax=Herbaspirillum rubrisubalbicans Os34 TaxID=1235827 RepID=A0A6M3ZTU9_9BURK|nr:hypothetical protein [Herbaspirillum rubrisubalbicans]QJQ00952.1 hypothetical protein C798_12120 [Herbaspirillum rubrisubalbicans Os34]
MTTIIAARFDLQEDAAQAVTALTEAGFAQRHISRFFVNPAGQHDRFALGGDRDKSPGAQDTDSGAVTGVAAGAGVGAAAGLATSPVTGPLGPALGGLVGGHVGGLVGSLSANDDDPAPRRAAGMRVAVAVADGAEQDKALRLLRSLGAVDIERSSGTIRDGDWIDFDPLSAPVPVEGAHG